MGPSHSALLTTEGNMYTWGIGKNGELGHNDNKSYNEPKLIEFFQNNDLRVT
jgi:alpha-tubulin suppressor-like RCC1 family protein